MCGLKKKHRKNFRAKSVVSGKSGGAHRVYTTKIKGAQRVNDIPHFYSSCKKSRVFLFISPLGIACSDNPENVFSSGALYYLDARGFSPRVCDVTPQIYYARIHITIACGEHLDARRKKPQR